MAMSVMSAIRARPLAPVCLLADSQLLFWKPDGKAPLLSSVLPSRAGPPRKAAYLGASNGDAPEFYALFVAAMAEIGIRACRHIHAALPAAEAAFLAEAELILLAGGDSGLGLQTLRSNGAAELILRRYHSGCVLLGVSAGAMQLGHSVILERDTGGELPAGLGLVPFIIDAHQEADGWRSLRRAVQKLHGAVPGLGISAGGGVLFHADGTLQPVRTAAYQLMLTGSELRQHTLPAAER